ncbi:MAG: hypothetical protein LDL51_07555 [Chloroflexi bacterium]|nr:hypothetical protein [Chloroflexota bacterium]
MLSPSDLLRLPYSPDLTEGGIAYALLSLQYGEFSWENLQNRTARAIVEIAFRRFLFQQGVPFEARPTAPFSAPLRYDVHLGGRRCQLETILVSSRRRISEFRKRPASLLKIPAPLPSGAGLQEHDLILFAFLLALTAIPRSDLKRIIQNRQPHCLIAAPPPSWRAPRRWQPLYPLALKSESSAPLTLEIHGQNEAREGLTDLVSLPPKTRVETSAPFFSVAALRIKSVPDGRIGVHSPVLHDTLLIPPAGWRNVWLYGINIFLAGYLTQQDLQRRERGKTFAVAELKPLREVFDRAREWSAARERVR